MWLEGLNETWYIKRPLRKYFWRIRAQNRALYSYLNDYLFEEFRMTGIMLGKAAKPGHPVTACR